MGSAAEQFKMDRHANATFYLFLIHVTSVPNPDPVGSEIVWLHGSGSIIGWFPGSGFEIINYGS